MTTLGPRLTLEDSFDRLHVAHMLDQPCLLVLPDGTAMRVKIITALEETAGGSLIVNDRLTTECEVQAAYGPGDRNILPTFKELQ